MNDTNLEFEFTLRPADPPALSHVLFEFRGSAQAWDDEQAAEVSLGTISGYRLDLAAAAVEGLDMRTFLDLVPSPQIADLRDAVFDRRTCHLAAKQDYGLSESPCECLIFIESIVVNAAHRDRCIGTFLLQRLTEILDVDNGLLALKARPIADDGSLGARDPADVARVRHFYERLGFEEVGHGFMAKDARTCAFPRQRRTGRELMEAT